MRIKLEDQGASVSIDTKGAELKSFKSIDGKEYMWQGNPIYWGKTSPVLFPLVCNVRNNRTQINGQWYEITKHGFARDMNFELIAQTKNKATFLLRHTEKTLKHFPFKFHFKLSYELVGEQLKIHYRVENLNEQVMPYYIGAHPAFNCPLEEGESFEEYEVQFEKEETIKAPIYDLEKIELQNDHRRNLLNHERTLALHYDLFDQDALVFEDLKSRTVSLIHKQTGKGVQVSFKGFTMLGIWTPIKKQAPFLCLEPWCGAAIYNDEDDEFIHKRGLQLLEPNEQKTYTITIQLLKAL